MSVPRKALRTSWGDCLSGKCIGCLNAASPDAAVGQCVKPGFYLMGRPALGGRIICESCPSIDVREWRRKGLLRTGQEFSWLCRALNEPTTLRQETNIGGWLFATLIWRWMRPLAPPE